MKPMDVLKALGLAVLVLALNLLATTAVIFVYSITVEPGHPPEFYNDMAPRIAAWSAPIGGMLLMFAVGLVFGRRRPERNAYAFAGLVFAWYFVVDTASGLAMATLAQIFTPAFLMSMAFTGLAGLAGASGAVREQRRRRGL